MRNPFRSEEAAFRFLLLVIGFLRADRGRLADQPLGGTRRLPARDGRRLSWWRDDARAVGGADQAGPGGPCPRPRRLLVVANETVGGPELLAELGGSARGRQDARCSSSRPRSTRRSSTGSRTRTAPAPPRASGSTTRSRRCAPPASTARGEIGDGDPLQAIEDALRTFAPDELVISTHPEGRSHWLERGVVEGAKRALRAAGDPRRGRSRGASRPSPPR